jgi:hypothetical protein
MKTKIIVIILMTLFLVLNTGVVFAATANPSYDAGYNAGYDEGVKNADNDVDAEDILDDFYGTTKFRTIRDSIDRFDYNAFDEGFIDGFEAGVRDNKTVNYSEELGRLLGEIYGARDYQNRDKSDWEDALPSDREIRNMFDLRVQDSDYREIFIESFKLSFREAYIESYEKAMFEPARITLEQGVEDGEELGELFGSIYGNKDYYEGKKLDYRRNLPSDRVITAEYSLNNDSDEYKKGFLSGFIRAFEEAYNEAYRKANLKQISADGDDAFTNGQEIGLSSGELQATIDYMSNKTNDWKRDTPDESYIVSEYGLRLQTSNYREGFVAGFYDGYAEGYNSKYKELAQGAGVNKSVSAIVPLAGTSLNSLDDAFKVIIQPGTFYHPVNLSINTTYDASLPVSSRLIKSSDSYRVRILNNSNNLDDKKAVLLSFEYYGDKVKGGIYKLENDSWLYIPSIIEDGVIYTYVSPSSIKVDGSTYSVFMDKEFILFPDARGHWANDEINTYVRRGVIYGYNDMTFKPERNITRAEFLTLLSRVYNWDISFYTANTSIFKDYNEFGNRNGVISYALNNGYIKGYGDGTFKPNASISYKEIEIIMGRALGNPYFKWSDVAIDMLHNKKVRSNSFNDMNNKITRAEVVYMLYTTTE